MGHRLPVPAVRTTCAARARARTLQGREECAAPARRALVRLYGDGWCTAEFAALPQKMRESVVKGLGKRTTPTNAFALLHATKAALRKLDTVVETWGDTVRDMVLAARKTLDDVVCSRAAECFEQKDWVDIMMADGVRFEEGETVEMFLESLRRGLNDKNAAMAYQVRVYQLPVESGPSQGVASGCRRLCPPPSFTDRPRSCPPLIHFTLSRPS